MDCLLFIVDVPSLIVKRQSSLFQLIFIKTEESKLQQVISCLNAHSRRISHFTGELNPLHFENEEKLSFQLFGNKNSKENYLAELQYR